MISGAVLLLIHYQVEKVPASSSWRDGLRLVKRLLRKVRELM